MGDMVSAVGEGVTSTTGVSVGGGMVGVPIASMMGIKLFVAVGVSTCGGREVGLGEGMMTAVTPGSLPPLEHAVEKMKPIRRNNGIYLRIITIIESRPEVIITLPAGFNALLRFTASGKAKTPKMNINARPKPRI